MLDGSSNTAPLMPRLGIRWGQRQSAQVGSRHNVRVGIHFPNDQQFRLSARYGAKTKDQEAWEAKRNAHSGP